MRNLEHVRARAREVREEIGRESDALLERIEAYLLRMFGKYLAGVPSEALEGSRAEVGISNPLVSYDEKLDRDPEQKILVIAHELGHLVLHDRLTNPIVPPDPLLGSAYMGSGAAGVARYSEKAKEEAQANAFAAEFLCPAQETLEEWQGGVTPAEVAQRRGIALELVYAQLAEALYRYETGQQAQPPGGPEREPTKAQKEAAGDFGRPVLVVAGPGTGKTRTLVLRIEYLLGRNDVRPEQLLVLTFSVEAADELRERIARQFGEPIADVMEISTFHGWGYTFLHHFALEAGRPEELILLDDAAQAELVLEILASVECDAILDLREPAETARRVAESIAFLKDRLIGPDEFEQEIRAWFPSEREPDTRPQMAALLALFREYEAEKERRSAVDFGDLIMLPKRILEGNAELRARVAAKHPWVMVDEYQDVSRAVAELLKQICGPDNPPWAVGDKRQAIYRFRGAHPQNVDEFEQDFPDAARHELDVNFRSGQAIVDVANELAALLEDPDHDGPIPARWRPDHDRPPVLPPAVTIAEANSDVAEREGIAAQVDRWVRHGVEKADIAVLARRNIDVRQISLALNQLGVRAVTTGLVTAEGAAGDLASVAALLDAPRAAVPRLTYALFRDTTPPGALNAAIEYMLASMDRDGAFEVQPIPGADGVVERIAQLRQALDELRFSADAWAVLCAFLFEDGEYLRNLLRQSDDPGVALAIEEVVTTLSVAAAHRYSHRRTRPRRSRLGFNDRLRDMLSQAKPLLTPPPVRRDAVRVMTCHASKGLEFPYVAVAGQTFPAITNDQSWIPPRLRPDQEEDARQADSLLFVGITRAERAVVVSHARSAGGTDRLRNQRRRPLLFERWAERSNAPRLEWDAGRAEPEIFRATGLWGGDYPELVPAYLLTGGGCAIRNYLQRTLQAEFPSAAESLWPMYVGVTRRAMQRVVQEANASGQPVDLARAIAVLDEEWEDATNRKHLLLPLYRRHAERRLARLAEAYHPDAVAAEELPSEVEIAFEGHVRMVRTNLLGYFRLPDGRRRAIGLEEGSLVGKMNADGEINWSDLHKGKLQWPFALLEEAGPGALEIFVYSDADGRIYPARWSKQKKSMTTARTSAQDQVGRGVSRVIESRIPEFVCARCQHRVHCPHWIGAGEPPV